jgi:alpha-L-fucosidase
VTDTWWRRGGRASATVTLTLPVATTFDVVSLQEAVDHRSQRIESFVIETWTVELTALPTVDDRRP